MAKVESYKVAQRKAGAAVNTVVGRSSGVYAPGIRKFKQGFRAGVKDGVVKGTKGQISEQVRQFKEQSWQNVRV